MRSILASYGRLLITTNENAGQRIRMRARHALYSATSARAGRESSGRVKQRRSRRSVLSLVCLLALIRCAAPDGGSGVRCIEVV
jgi:hypothetical protein